MLDFVVPTRRNRYHPYLLRQEMVGAIAVLAVLLSIGAYTASRIITVARLPNMAAVVESVLVSLANGDRVANGLGKLSENATLQEVAQMKADDMAAKGYFAHMTPDGHDPWYWFDKAGYRFSSAGENLAVYFTDSSDVERAWMNSPEHRANILGGYTEVGIATAQGMYEGRPTVFVAEEFGTPAASDEDVSSPSQSAEVAASVKEVSATSGQSTAQKLSQKTQITHSALVPQPRVLAMAATTPVPLRQVPEGEVRTDLSSEDLTKPAAWELLVWQIVTSPQTTLRIIYEAIGIVVALPLILLVAIEIYRREWGKSLIGILFLILMTALFVLEMVATGIVQVA